MKVELIEDGYTPDRKMRLVPVEPSYEMALAWLADKDAIYRYKQLLRVAPNPPATYFDKPEVQSPTAAKCCRHQENLQALYALWEPVFQWGLKNHECKLGESIPQFVLRKLQEFDRLRAPKPQANSCPINCRERLRMEGKPYPRNSCEVCGRFSPQMERV